MTLRMKTFWILLFSLILFAAPAHAQSDSMKLTLSPIFITLTADPGSSSSGQISVRNDGTETENLNVGVKKFTASTDGESPLIIDPGKEDEFISWIRFNRTSLRIPPGRSQTVSFTITPPKEASLGYYYLVAFSRVSLQGAEKNSVSLSGVPAVPVLLEVRSPNAQRELSITKFKTSQWMYEYLPTTFELTIENKGNVHVSPVGDIFIDQGRKKTIASMPINPGRGNVLPGTKRTFFVVWEDGFPLKQKTTKNGALMRNKDGSFVTKAVWDFSNVDAFRIGRYTAHVIVLYDNGQRDVPIESQTTFWVLPWKIMLGGLALLVLVGLGVRSLIVSITRLWRRSS